MKTTRERAKERILKYRERASLDLSGDVLQWWRFQGDPPLLPALAKHYLSIPSTSVASERVFSTAGDIVTAQRSLLAPEHVDQLVFMKKNLKKDICLKFSVVIMARLVLFMTSCRSSLQFFLVMTDLM